MQDKIVEKLNERIAQGRLRALPGSSHLVDFVSNDYLGLGRSRELFDKIQNHDYSQLTNLNGSTGSRLLAGNATITEQLEGKLSKIFNAENALLFNSGYVANLAIMSSIPQRGDTIIYDQLAHVCIKEGAWLSKAKSYSFRHNDCDDLEYKLKNAEGDKYVVIESVYSMDGDFAPFHDIVKLAQQYDANLIIDEAHGTGLFGMNGSGKICELGLEDNFFARIYTFGKAMGVHGACVVGSHQLIEYLINFARPFIYTTALPPHAIFSIGSSFEYLADNQHLQDDVQKKIDHFNALYEEKIGGHLFKLPSSTPIQPVVVPGNERAKQLAKALQSAGFDVRPILSPTVKAGEERLRISIHTHNSNEEIRDLIDQLSSHL